VGSMSAGKNPKKGVFVETGREPGLGKRPTARAASQEDDVSGGGDDTGRCRVFGKGRIPDCSFCKTSVRGTEERRQRTPNRREEEAKKLGWGTPL